MVESRAAEQSSGTPGPQGTTGTQITHVGHGSSVASWTLVGLIMLGSLLLCLSVAVVSVPLAVIGGVVVIAGLVAGKVLSAMGYGVAGHR